MTTKVLDHYTVNPHDLNEEQLQEHINMCRSYLASLENILEVSTIAEDLQTVERIASEFEGWATRLAAALAVAQNLIAKELPNALRERARLAVLREATYAAYLEANMTDSSEYDEAEREYKKAVRRFSFLSQFARDTMRF